MPEEKFIRPGWDDYFMGIIKAIAARATCDRGRSGCCIVREKRILVTGYVGAPSGCVHCDEVGHEMNIVRHTDGHESQHCIRTTHAEQNAICEAAYLGVSLRGATMYCRMTPCYTCAKMIINCGIERVVCEKDYHAGGRSKEIFAEAGIKLEILNPEIVKYDNQSGFDFLNNPRVKKFNQKVLAVVGMPGSGKTEVSRYIESQGFKKVYFGQATFDEIARRGLGTNEANEKMVREDLRQQYGMAAYAILSLPKIKEYYDAGENVVIESLYSWQEYLKIKEEFGDNFRVIAVQAPPQVRYDRVVGRVEYKNEVQRNFTHQDLESRDRVQIENLAIAGPIAMADFAILNNGTIDELYQKVDEVLEKIQPNLADYNRLKSAFFPLKSAVY